MIFVSVGTVAYPFKRLADFVNRYSRSKSNERFVIQSGYTNCFKISKNVSAVKFMTINDVIKYTKKARIVIVHGGEGSVYTSLKYAVNMPYVCPRLSQLKEHVDNQQVLAVRRLKRSNMVLEIDPVTTKNLLIFKNKHRRFSSDAEDDQAVNILDRWTMTIGLT